MFFLQLPEVYISLEHIISIDKRFREIQMINGDKYDSTEEEINRIAKLLEIK